MMRTFELVHEDFPERFVVAKIDAPDPGTAMALAEAEGLTFDFEPGTYWLVGHED